jgi:DNA-binding MarR family transcriptional regulator
VDASSSDPLVELFERADRATVPVTLRWLLHAEIPLLPASVMLVLDPEDAPLTAGQVAEAIGISVDDAMRALHELRSMGYAHEVGRRHEPTEKGRLAHESLAAARRNALMSFVSGLSEDERRRLHDS